MLEVPCAGWSVLRIKDFAHLISYLTHPVLDLLDAFIDSKKHYGKPVTVKFEAESEGSFYVTFTQYETFAFGYSSVFDPSGIGDKYHMVELDVDIDELAKILYDDVTKDLIAWSRWDAFGETEDEFNEEASQRQKEIEGLMSELKDLYKL